MIFKKGTKVSFPWGDKKSKNVEKKLKLIKGIILSVVGSTVKIMSEKGFVIYRKVKWLENNNKMKVV